MLHVQMVNHIILLVKALCTCDTLEFLFNDFSFEFLSVIRCGFHGLDDHWIFAIIFHIHIIGWCLKLFIKSNTKLPINCIEKCRWKKN